MANFYPHSHDSLHRSASSAPSVTRQPSVEIDDSLYSRQRYVLGDEAMKQMHKASVLIMGLGGLGVEIAKNLVLGGVRKVSLWDNAVSQWTDLSSNFYITDDDVKEERLRVDACLGKLRELNPGVTVEIFRHDLTLEIIRDFPKHFNCVIATELPLSIRIAINQSLRADSGRNVPFISADAFGITAGVFCDFGEEFTVHDPRAEEGRELLIAQITQAEKGQVTCMEGYFHRLDVGDLVEFKDVSGMTELNGRIFTVEKVVSPLSFCVGDTTQFSRHDHGGIAKQMPKPESFKFQPLEQSMLKPSVLLCDLARPNAAHESHVVWMTLMNFLEKHHRLPRPHNGQDINELMDSAQHVAKALTVEDCNKTYLRNAFSASSGQLNPLVSTMGGVVAQEAMKALTGKFRPLVQWLYLDARDIFGGTCTIQNDRYDGIRICVGDQVVEKLKSLRLFMVGCGAIGCEMLKNLALIGAGCSPTGKIQITDDDHIEKSNLNRQFLFRPEHISHSKSEVAAQRIQHINPNARVHALKLRVQPSTQKAPFSDDFFQKTDIVINALDNVQARLYMDSRCVANGKPLLDSGTLGTRGHVQVVIPYLTESYGSKRDPAENAADSIPYCTLKQFPALMEHCIEWAREKFQSSFSVKPEVFNTFWQQHGPSTGQLLQRLHDNTHMEGIPLAYKLISRRPKNVQDLVQLARVKFEKYFSFKAQQLLHMFPLDHTVDAGAKFWQSPKRPPIPIAFNPEDPLHLEFIRAACTLYGKIYGVTFSYSDLAVEHLKSMFKHIKVPPFVPKGREIELKDGPVTHHGLAHNADDAKQLEDLLEISLENGDYTKGDTMVMHPEVFEKDNDGNAHIDFIYAAANLRARMYKIEQTDRIHVKRIAGRIVPAIATTTACVSGLATLELIKLAQDLSKMKPETKHLLTEKTLERYKNAFLCLAAPEIYFAEPGASQIIKLPGGVNVTLWDQWSIAGTPKFTMQNFLDAVKTKYNLTVSSILLGAKMVYMPFMPEHRKRLHQPFDKYLDPLPANEDYVDLSVDMEADEIGDVCMDDNDNGIMWPPVRYYFR